MTYLVIAAIGLTLFSLVAFKVADDMCGGIGEAALAALGTLSALAGTAGLVVTIVFGFQWVASEHKAKIVNSEYGTNYTREDIFYASDVIDTIREVQRQRIELNGDLLRGDRK